MKIKELEDIIKRLESIERKLKLLGIKETSTLSKAITEINRELMEAERAEETI